MANHGDVIDQPNPAGVNKTKIKLMVKARHGDHFSTVLAEHHQVRYQVPADICWSLEYKPEAI